MKLLFELFATFMKIGGFTFGGGYAMLPMIQKKLWKRRDGLPKRKSWITLQ